MITTYNVENLPLPMLGQINQIAYLSPSQRNYENKIKNLFHGEYKLQERVPYNESGLT